MEIYTWNGGASLDTHVCFVHARSKYLHKVSSNLSKPDHLGIHTCTCDLEMHQLYLSGSLKFTLED